MLSPSLPGRASVCLLLCCCSVVALSLLCKRAAGVRRSAGAFRRGMDAQPALIQKEVHPPYRPVETCSHPSIGGGSGIISSSSSSTISIIPLRVRLLPSAHRAFAVTEWLVDGGGQLQRHIAPQHACGFLQPTADGLTSGHSSSCLLLRLLMLLACCARKSPRARTASEKQQRWALWRRPIWSTGSLTS